MAYSAIDTWDVASDTFPTVVTAHRRGVRSPVDGGMVHRRQTYSSEGAHGQAGIRTFSLTYSLAPKSAYNRAVELWKKTKGGSEGLSYTISDTAYGSDETIIVRMIAAPFMLRQMSPAHYGFSVELEEMLHAP